MRLSFGAEDSYYGSIFYDTETGKVDFWDSPSRDMLTFNIELNDNSNEEIKKLLMYHENDCIRLRMTGYPGLVDVKQLDWHYLLQKEFVSTGGQAVGPQFAPSDLINDWTAYCEEYDIDKAVRRYGRVYMS